MSAPAIKPVRVAALACPECGAPIPLRSLGYARTVACASCTAVLDASDPNLRVLAASQQKLGAVKLILPLGARGTLAGRAWEVIGAQVRTIKVDGIGYSWREYVLFNPVHGFRYLTEYDGHWSWVQPLRRTPVLQADSDGGVATLDETTFRHFQTAVAATRFVVGEFPWEVRVGDKATCADFVAPPRILSSEKTDGEQTWSLGTYLPASEVYAAFGLKDPPAPMGVYANQPNRAAARREAMWPAFLLSLSAILVLVFVPYVTARQERVFSGDFWFNPRPGATADTTAFVTDTFVVRGRTSNLELKWDATVENNWIYLDLALIDLHTGRALELGRELSYYYGWDGAEHWTEGRRDERIRIPSVPPGTYYLRVAPSAGADLKPIYYTLALTRDVPGMTFPLLAMALVALPIGVTMLQARSFEQRRWMESDHPPTGSSDDDD